MKENNALPRKTGESPAKNRVLLVVLQIVTAMLAIHLLWNFAGVFLYSLLLKTEVVERDYFQHCIEGRGLLGFRESVIFTEGGGRLSWLKAEGQRVKVGEEVAKLTTRLDGEIIMTAPVSGLFSSHIDGLEESVYPHREWFPEKEVFLNLEPAPQGFQSGEEVPPGSPLFKVMDNFTWFYNLVIDGEEAVLLEESRRLLLDFDFDDGLYPVDSLKRQEMEGGGCFVRLALSRDAGDFYRRRWENARVIYRREEGVSLPASALLDLDGVTGVYRLVRNSIVFVEVQILGESVEKGRLVAAGLEPGWEIVTNPRFFREGQRF